MASICVSELLVGGNVRVINRCPTQEVVLEFFDKTLIECPTLCW